MKKQPERKSKSISKAPVRPKKPFPGGRRLSFFYLILLAIIFGCFYGYVYDKKVFLGGDNAVYYITGVSIAEGHGYSNLNLPGNPPANHFPVGYPALISVIVTLFGETMQAVKIANGLFLFGVVALLFLIVSELTKNKHLAFVVSLLTLLNPHMLFYSYIEMSEMSFTFFALLSLAMFIKTFRTGSSLRQPYFWLLLISIIVTFYIRSLGIAGLAAAVVVLSFNKRWLQAGVLTACFMLAYAPWMIRSNNLGGNTYAQQVKMVNPYRPELGTLTLSDYPKRMIENLDRYTSKEIISALTGYAYSNDEYDKKSTWERYLIGSILLFLIIAGIFSLKEFRWYIFILMATTFFILLLWPPVWEGIRFMLPLIPLIIFFIVKGTLFLTEKVWVSANKNKYYLNYAPYVFTLLLIQDRSMIILLHEGAIAQYPPNYKDYFDLAKWSNKNLPDTAIICTRKPELFYLFAKRKCSGIPLIKNNTEMLNYLKKEKVTHVVEEHLGFSSTGLYMAPVVNANIEKFYEIKRISEETAIYKISYDDKYGYVGEMKNGMREGKGTAQYSNGDTYTGEWKNGKYDGQGIYYYPNGDYFTGEWKEGKRNGYGRLYHDNGMYITGKWENDLVSGPAVVYTKDDKIFTKGEWRNQGFVPSGKNP